MREVIRWVVVAASCAALSSCGGSAEWPRCQGTFDGEAAGSFECLSFLRTDRELAIHSLPEGQQGDFGDFGFTARVNAPLGPGTYDSASLPGPGMRLMSGGHLRWFEARLDLDDTWINLRLTEVGPPEQPTTMTHGELHARLAEVKFKDVQPGRVMLHVTF